MTKGKPRKLMNRRTFLNASSTAAGAIAVSGQFSCQAVGQTADERRLSASQDHYSGANAFAPVSARGGRGPRHSIDP